MIYVFLFLLWLVVIPICYVLEVAYDKDFNPAKDRGVTIAFCVIWPFTFVLIAVIVVCVGIGWVFKNSFKYLERIARRMPHTLNQQIERDKSKKP